MAFDRILVPLDGSHLAEESLVHAARLSHAYHSRLFLLRVLEVRSQHNSIGHKPEDLDWRLYRIQATEYLNSLTDRFTREGIEVESHVLEGRAPDQIMEFIRDRRIDLVVLCAYGWGGVSKFPFGGTVPKIIAAPETSVMVVRPMHGRPDARGHYRRILVPLDGSQRAAWAVSLVSGMVDSEAPEVILLQVVGVPDMPRTHPLTHDEMELRDKLVESNRRAAASYLEEIRKRFSSRLSVSIRLEVSERVVDTIEAVAETEDVDLIALTAHGVSGSGDRTAGTICQSVVLLASRPVLVLQDNPTRYHDEAPASTSVRTERRIWAV